MIQIQILDELDGFGNNYKAYGSICRWTTHGRWRGVPVMNPLEGDPAWGTAPEDSSKWYYPEWDEDGNETGWFTTGLIIWLA